jgi:hypothetical protein
MGEGWGRDDGSGIEDAVGDNHETHETHEAKGIE